MKKLIAASVLALMATASAHAGEWKVGAITISDAFARATAGKAIAGGGFMKISNAGEADQLISASADVGAKTELHTHIMDGDVMRMRKVEGIEVPANGEVALKPGGYHVMFMGLKQPLKKGESFPLELTFEKTGKVVVDVEIADIGAKMAPHDHGNKHDDHGHKHGDDGHKHDHKN